MGFDTETSGPSITWRKKSRPDPYRATLTGFSVSTGLCSWYVPVDHAEGHNLPREAVAPFLAWLVQQARRRRVWAHNWKFELQILKNYGIDYGPFSDHMHCSQVAAWLAGWGADHDSLALKALAEAHGFGAGATFAEVAKKRQSRDIPVEEITPYAGRDAFLACGVGEAAWVELERHDLTEHYRTIDMPLVEILRGTEAWGVPVDEAALLQLRDTLEEEADALAAEFRMLTSVPVIVPTKERVHRGEFFKNGNPKLVSQIVDREFVLGADVGNDGQVSRWCYTELKCWPLRVGRFPLQLNDVGHYPVDKETIERWLALPDPLGRRLAEIRLEYGKRSKLLTTYVKPLLELPKQWGDGRVHCSYNLTGTETQRFSSSGPNLQNLPSRTEEGQRIRAALLAPKGWEVLVLDYSQIELRIAAHLSQDPAMLAAYLFEEDIHQNTLDAMRIGWPEAQRTDAKITNFSTIYGITPASLAIKMHSTEQAAEQSIDAFFARYPKIETYHRQAVAYARKHGHARTIDGFKRVLDVPAKSKKLPWKIANQAINTPIQGSAGGLAKIAMVRAHRRWVEAGEYGTRVQFVSQEHDSLICNSRKDFTEQALIDLKDAMETAWPLRVPLVADGGAGSNWKAAKAA
jgi:DNA polymerase I